MLLMFSCWSSPYRYGRKPVFFITMAVQTVFTVALIFSPSWIVFSIIFFISGMGQMANYMAAFVLGTCTFNTSFNKQNNIRCSQISDLLFNLMTILFPFYVCAGTETLSGRVRTLFSSLGVCLGFTIGSLLVPLIAFLIRDWKPFLLATSLPALVYILLWW